MNTKKHYCNTFDEHLFSKRIYNVNTGHYIRKCLKCDFIAKDHRFCTHLNFYSGGDTLICKRCFSHYKWGRDGVIYRAYPYNPKSKYNKEFNV